MPGLKISELVDGGEAEDGDLIEIERPGSPSASLFVPLGSGASFPRAVRSQKLVFLGDSNVSRGQSVSSPIFATTSVGFASWAKVLTGQRFYSPPSYNLGVGGRNSTTVLSADVPLALALAPDVAVVHVGTNDAAGGTAAAVTIASLTAIYDAFYAAGVTVVAVPILGRSDGLLSSDEAKNALRVNEFIRNSAFTRKNFWVADCGVAFDDPASSAWEERSGFTVDDLHTSSMGAQAVGEVVAGVLDDALPGPWRIPVSNALDLYDAALNPQGNLCGSGLMLGTGGSTSGGGTGDVATGWTFVGSLLGGATAVCAKSTFADGRVAQQLTLSGTYTGSTRLAQFQNTLTHGNFAQGDTIEAECEIEVTDGAENIVATEVMFQSGEGGTNFISSSFSGSTLPHTRGWRGVVRTYPRVLSAAPTSAFVICRVLFTTPGSSTAIDAVVKFGSVAVRKAT